MLFQLSYTRNNNAQTFLSFVIAILCHCVCSFCHFTMGWIVSYQCKWHVSTSPLYHSQTSPQVERRTVEQSGVEQTEADWDGAQQNRALRYEWGEWVSDLFPLMRQFECFWPIVHLSIRWTHLSSFGVFFSQSSERGEVDLDCPCSSQGGLYCPCQMESASTQSLASYAGHQPCFFMFAF